jgi:hypothetical protein
LSKALDSRVHTGRPAGHRRGARRDVLFETLQTLLGLVDAPLQLPHLAVVLLFTLARRILLLLLLLAFLHVLPRRLLLLLFLLLCAVLPYRT